MLTDYNVYGKKKNSCGYQVLYTQFRRYSSGRAVQQAPAELHKEKCTIERRNTRNEKIILRYPFDMDV